MRILVACDKFKGSLDASLVNTCLANGIQDVCKEVNITQISMADGGEGTLDFLVNFISGNVLVSDSFDPLGKPIQVRYLVDEDDAVYLESALICGLGLVDEKLRNPLTASTFGLGYLMKNLVSQGKKRIHLFLGGSATNDGGAGMLAGLGFIFLDERGERFVPVGGNLHQVTRIIAPSRDELPDFTLQVWTDVDIPVLGNFGCSHLFSRQKGAGDADVNILEAGMNHYTTLVETLLSRKGIESISGAGAAGGTPFSCLAFLQAELGNATSFLFAVSRLEQVLASSDLIITGEGSFDNQSIQGKLVQKIARISKKHDKPCYVVCGQNSLSADTWFALGISKVMAITDIQPKLSNAMENACDYLKKMGRLIGVEIGDKQNLGS